jgi:hypothetical protein
LTTATYDFEFESRTVRARLLEYEEGRAAVVERQLQPVTSPSYVEELSGTVGADPFTLQTKVE